MGNNTQASKVVEKFQELFVRLGPPKHVVTDNDRQYTSKEFKLFLDDKNIKHSFSPPYHLATNGAAENFVATFKNSVTKMVKGGKKIKDTVNKFLEDYRSTTHCTTGKSPAWLMYKREFRTRFDLLRPSVVDKVEKEQMAQVTAVNGHRKVKFQVGDVVMADDHRVRREKRAKAVITKRLRPVTFEVQVQEGETWKPHADQLIKISCENRAPRRSARLQERPKGLEGVARN
ncbi:uncharacterized protein K02A2.6-like [Venturia canescens]|uniref:uncharacterized protein K02A2.6-like n=1 Tax=Venturia canescens TaxID=32260 RepID=UPI001C9CC553|nr:uncharacterized protein K02A2.6-like [Venturia canescens]